MAGYAYGKQFMDNRSRIFLYIVGWQYCGSSPRFTRMHVLAKKERGELLLMSFNVLCTLRSLWVCYYTTITRDCKSKTTLLEWNHPTIPNSKLAHVSALEKTLLGSYRRSVKISYDIYVRPQEQFATLVLPRCNESYTLASSLVWALAQTRPLSKLSKTVCMIVDSTSNTRINN